MSKNKEIVIIGAGIFGATIAKKLSELPKHTIVVIDSDKDKVDALAKFIDIGYIGDASDEDFLINLGIESAETFIVGIGQNIESSLLIASIISKNFKGNIIAKATDANHIRILESLGVQDIISPDVTAARRAVAKVLNPVLFKGQTGYTIHEMEDGMSMIKVPVLKESVGKKVMDLGIGKSMKIILIYRKNKTILVHGDTKIQTGDVVTLLGKWKEIVKLLENYK